MTSARSDLHVYLRSLAQGERTSLSVLAGLVTPGASVLDLGTGSGALGQHLRETCRLHGRRDHDQRARKPTSRVPTTGAWWWPTWSTPDGRTRSPAHATTSSFAPTSWNICASPETALRVRRELLAPRWQGADLRPERSLWRAGGRTAGRRLHLPRGRPAGPHPPALFHPPLAAAVSRRARAGRSSAMERHRPAPERVGIPAPLSTSCRRPSPATFWPCPTRAPTSWWSRRSPARSRRRRAGRRSGPASPSRRAVFRASFTWATKRGFHEDEEDRRRGRRRQERAGAAVRAAHRRQAPTRLRLDPADRPGFLHLHRIALLVR